METKVIPTACMFCQNKIRVPKINHRTYGCSLVEDPYDSTQPKRIIHVSKRPLWCPL